MKEEFDVYLKKGGRSVSAVKRICSYLREFEHFLVEQCICELNSADTTDLESFVAWFEQSSKSSAKGHLWGLGYYFEYTSNSAMRQLASILREQRIERKPFPLQKFRGINFTDLEKLESVGIKHVKQMLAAGATPSLRTALAKRTGVAESVILEVLKMADLSRIPGVKSVRARLYYDAGIDTLEKMSGWEPGALLEMLNNFIGESKYEGIAPFPAEVRFTIATAKQLPKVVEY